MKTRKTIIFLLLVMTTSFTYAQDVVTQMNSIKLNKDFVYGQATHLDADSAYMEALKELIISLEERLGGKDKVDMEQVKSKIKRLSRQRGKRVQVMAYMKVENRQTVDVPKPTPTIGDQPSPTPSVDSVSMSSVPTPSVELSTSLYENKRLAPLVKDLMKVDNLDAAVYTLNTRKRSGTLADWKAYKDAEHPENMYVLVFDPQDNIPLAVLSPEKTNGMRDNLTNNKEESLSLYKNKLALCFMMK